ncbi:MAG: hypothetical protein LBT27_05205 [Prevotellaceae bacterium]|jgi:hypothetical protein|nr:hypothetical protein [Prevotellaceae bacterium]
MIDGRYTIAELYLLLKLDIWRQGDVVGCKWVKKLNADTDGNTGNGYIGLQQPIWKHIISSYKKQLDIGLYLLNLYSQKKTKKRDKLFILQFVEQQWNILNKNN